MNLFLFFKGVSIPSAATPCAMTFTRCWPLRSLAFRAAARDVLQPSAKPCPALNADSVKEALEPATTVKSPGSCSSESISSTSAIGHRRERVSRLQRSSQARVSSIVPFLKPTAPLRLNFRFSYWPIQAIIDRGFSCRGISLT